MAKTIGQLITLAGAVAVNVIPGLGQLASAAILVGSAVAGQVISSLATGKAQKPDSTVQNIKTPIPPRVYAYGRSRLHGASILFETASDGTTVDVYAFADGKADGIEQAYLNDDKVTVNGGVVQALPDKKYQGDNVRAGWNLGNAVETAFAAVIAKLPGIWTANHRGDGVVTGYLLKNPEKEKYYLETYPQGDNVELSLVGRWQLCFDPRDGATRWTENPVLQLLHYLTVRRNYDYAKRILPTLQYWIDAANICDEAVPLKNGGTEPRYRSCVTYDSRAASKEVRASFLETFDGWMGTRGDGAIIIYAGKVYTPTVTIGPDDIISYKLDTNVEDENRVDQYTVGYVSAAHDYNTVDCTPWGDQTGDARTDAFSPQSPSFSQNRRLAKRKMAQVNAPKRGSCVTNLGGRKMRGHRYVYLDLAEDGFDPFDGILPIVEVTSLQRDFQAGGLAFDWLLTDTNIDAWNPDTEEGEPAAVGDRVAAQPLETPLLVSAEAQYSDVGQSSGEGGSEEDPASGSDPQAVTGVRILMVASGPADRADLTWYARWRSAAAATWNEREYTDADPGPGITLLTEFVPYGTEVEVQASYGVGDGRISDWSNSLFVQTNP